MIPATTTRVQENTDETINKRIRAQTERNIEYFARKGGAAIDERLEELDREWDVERLLETNAASLALLGVGLGAFVDRRFLLLPALVVHDEGVPARLDGSLHFEIIAVQPGAIRYARLVVVG